MEQVGAYPSLKFHKQRELGLLGVQNNLQNATLVARVYDAT